VRYDENHKEESRKKILLTAAREFRRHGAERVRIGDVMQAAGLTHGGFYRHFPDKDQLLVEAMSTALAEVSEQLQALTKDLPRHIALRKVIDYYLSEAHLQHPGSGCALAALGTDMGRLPRKSRLILEKTFQQYSDRLSPLMPGSDDAARRSAFDVLFPGMAGCLMGARAQASSDRRRALLEAARHFYIQAFCQAENNEKEPKRSEQNEI